VTRDRAAIGGPLTVRSEDLTHISVNGLLPQLIDLLHALTEGQELLSRKVRDARLEYTCQPAPVDERCPHTEPSDSAVPRSFMGTSPNAGTPADPSNETSTRTDWLNSARPGVETTTAQSNRDYNFFDELDARLADLQDPPGRPGDS